MLFDDSVNNSQQPSVAPTDSLASSANAPAASVPSAASPSSEGSTASGFVGNDENPLADRYGRIHDFPQNPNRSVKPQVVSNAQQPDTTHPAIKHASLVHDIAETLAGGPQYTVTIDDNGNRIRTAKPLSPRQIGLAIALSAVQGSLTGLAAGRGRGPGAAGAAAFQQAFAQRQQQQQRQDEQAQQEFNDRAKTLASKASIAEINSRTLLNTAESEKYGAEALDKLIEINRASGLLDVDPDALDNGGQPMTQAELTDAMVAGRLNFTDHLGPIVGRVEVTNPDGSRRWEATHLIVRDPNSKVTITPEQWDRFVSGNVPGFAGKLHGNGTEIKLSMMQRANEILAAHTLTDYRLKEMRDVLAGTPYASQVPTSIDFSKPGADAAMSRFQKYVSHSAQHGMDVYESLQAMGADKRDPKTGQMAPNGDAKYVDQVAAAFGGWPVLEAVHNQLAANKKAATEFSIIDSEAKANAVLASPGKFTKDQVSTARNFLSLSQQQGAAKAAQEARQRAIAEGKDTEAMYKTGVNPITGEKLTLANAPDSMLVDSKGRPVPQNMQSFYKPSQNERQTADTARQVLAISGTLRAAVGKNPNLIGPLLGNSKSALAKLGLGDAEAQKMLDDVAFLQSAATKMHTGRFSNEILKKMNNLIKPGMNTDQFKGALNSIDEVAGRYAQEDKLVTVADFREMQQGTMNAVTTARAPGSAPAAAPKSNRPVGW
jgi:hypothetical protein